VVWILLGTRDITRRRAWRFLRVAATCIRVERDGSGHFKCRRKRFADSSFRPNASRRRDFCFIVFEVLLILKSKSVFPLQRFFEVVIIVQAPLAASS